MFASSTNTLLRFVSALTALLMLPMVAAADGLDSGIEEEPADPEHEPPPSIPGVVYSPTFLDVADDAPFAGEIRSMVAAGVTRGCDEIGSHFCPDGYVTRGQMAAFLVRVLGLEPGEARFSDTEDSVFTAEIAALAQAGITSGCNPPDNTRFCPNDPISRGQMAAFLARAMDLEPGGVSFTDTSGHLFEAEVAALAATGITRGCNPPDNTRFCPDEPITREQMAAFLLRSGTVEPVPSVPPGVAFARHPLSEDLHQTQVEVCPAGGEVTVLHAARGSMVGEEGELSDVTVTAGDYDFETDVWVVPSDEPCSHLVADWLVGPPDFYLPIARYVITSRFGVRVHPIHGTRRMHSGVDMAAPTGTAVKASATGTVTAAGHDGDYGKAVVIAHQNGYSTRYAHLSRISVRVGDEVGTGTVVGAVGCTGSCTGPHLHFEIRKHGVARNPLDFLIR